MCEINREGRLVAQVGERTCKMVVERKRLLSSKLLSRRDCILAIFCPLHASLPCHILIYMYIMMHLVLPMQLCDHHHQLDVICVKACLSKSQYYPMHTRLC